MSVQIDVENGFSLELDLVLNAPRQNVWRCWAEPHLLKQWFCPPPWYVSDARIDMTPGGACNNTMCGPDGERMENTGIFLDVVPGESFTTTDAFSEGFIPKADHFMTGYTKLEDAGPGQTRMIWGARHPTYEKAKQHLDMGWEQGWTMVARQLETLAASL